MSQVDITAIFPAHNEAAAIETTVLETVDYMVRRGYVYEIIVVADGDDGTREIVGDLARQDPHIRIFGGSGRRGKGFAVRQAVAAARGDIVFYADADNKVPIEEADKFVPCVRGGDDLVIGCRASEQSAIERPQPWYRRAGGRGFHFFMQAVVGLPGIHDSQCGFKFFRSSVARRLFACQKIDGYMFDVEILFLAQRFGYRIRELPIRWRDDGDSRLQLFRGNLRNVRDIFRIRLLHAGVAHARVAESGCDQPGECN